MAGDPIPQHGQVVFESLMNDSGRRLAVKDSWVYLAKGDDLTDCVFDVKPVVLS